MTDLPPLRVPHKVEVAQLSFDPENPRFTPDIDVDIKSDQDVIRELDRSADLGELVQSIAASGYVDIEPLVVLQSKNNLIVLEGNRRLAALKILLDPKLAEAAGITLPPIDETKRGTFSCVTVYRVETREEARDFIGFKHINGPHRWDSYAKAHFAAEWFLRERSSGVTLRDIARRMGDRHDTIKRMVAGYFVLKQATNNRLFLLAERYPQPGPVPLSHLYIALTRPPYRDFLGLPEDWRSEDPKPDPVPVDHHENLKRLLIWLFGSGPDDVPPIVRSQNPHVKHLGEVLAVPRARTMLMAQGDLKSAHQLVERPAEAFEQALTGAYNQLTTAQGRLESYDGSDRTLLEVAIGAEGKSKLILQWMQQQARKHQHADAPSDPDGSVS